MGDYMLMVLEDETAHAAQAPKDMAELIEQRARFADRLRAGGKLRDAGRLRPSREGKRVRPQRVDDGPFAEDGKALGAYYWIEAASVDDAAKLAAECPVLPADELDVRPVMKGGIRPDKEGKPGKIFACAVLGNALTEQAWIDVMDRIDADTTTRFPADSSLGGNRLQPPSTGKRVATRGERRAVFDGPFLEAKEVIGGVFLMRMASLDDVVAWALGSGFLAHGALEIRELWRT
ncbi:MAG: YciI family protein [Acidobacteriota bacterium]